MNSTSETGLSEKDTGSDSLALWPGSKERFLKVFRRYGKSTWLILAAFIRRATSEFLAAGPMLVGG